MKSPLIPIDILSIYNNKLGDRIPLPKKMAICTPDTHRAIIQIASELKKMGGNLILSDLFRTYEMQLQAHNDHLSKKKTAYSPPPGGSFHEAGRAFDIDLKAMKIPLAEFWKIAEKYGVVPIIAEPKSSLKEAWHFDCRGSHQLVYQYYTEGNGNNFKPYTAAAASAILSTGIKVNSFGANQKQAAIQSCLIRLGRNIGNIDGQIGNKTQGALEEYGINLGPNNIDEILMKVENLVQQCFPDEFKTPSV